MDGRTVGVAVVEDHPLYREALTGAVAAAPDLEVLYATATIEAFERASAGHRQPDVVLLDLTLPGVGGADGVRRLVGRGLRVLVVSAGAARAQVLDVVAAGAAGYLAKSAEAVEIVAAVRAVAAGGTAVAPRLLGPARQDGPGVLPSLTARERDVLLLLAAGRTDRQIADELLLSPRTVRSHLDRIRDKTGQRRRAELTRLAVREGLVRDER